MKKILKDTYKGLDEKNEKQSENEKQLAVRVNENKFQIKKNDDVKRAYGRMFAYDVPSENSGKSYNANLISYEENQKR